MDALLFFVKNHKTLWKWRKLVLVYKSERSIAVVGRVFVASKRVVEPIEMDLPRLAIVEKYNLSLKKISYNLKINKNTNKKLFKFHFLVSNKQKFEFLSLLVK